MTMPDLLTAFPMLTQEQSASVQAWAAIVQAVSSFVALIVAVGVPLWLAISDRKRQAREREQYMSVRKSQARSLAFKIAPDLSVLSREIETCREALETKRELMAEHPDRNYGRGVDYLEKPSLLLESLDRIYLLGSDVDLLVAEVLNRINSFNAISSDHERLDFELTQLEYFHETLQRTIRDRVESLLPRSESLAE